MGVSSLLSLSPLDGRYCEQVEVLRPYFSEFGLISARVEVELSWLLILGDTPEIKEVPPFSEKTRALFKKKVADFSLADALRVKEIEKITNHDVKAVEYWLKEQFTSNPEVNAVKEFFHFAATSEDINNVSYALMLKKADQAVFTPMMNEVIHAFETLALSHAAVAMMSHTHGQPATPTTVGKEFATIAYRLKRQLKRKESVPFLAKFNGAVGNYNAHIVAYPEVDWLKVSYNFIKGLGLEPNPYTLQIEPHDALAEYFQVVSLWNTLLIDADRDIWGYIALNYFKQKPKAGEVGSSTMPHKVNPIDFENSEGNLGVANALLNHLVEKLPISRWQRDLSDSTVLRNLGLALGHSVLAMKSLLKGLDKLEVNQERIGAHLKEHWELLAEPIQTVMRRYGLENPYERLKALTRGNTQIDEQVIRTFIEGLPELPEEAKNRLLTLKPENYIGKAEALARAIN